MIEVEGKQYYQTNDIACDSGYSFATVLREAHLMNMELVSYHQYTLFTEEQRDILLKVLIERAKNKPVRVQTIINNKKMTIEEMRKKHPLVTDDRFFTESYFPNVIPNC